MRRLWSACIPIKTCRFRAVLEFRKRYIYLGRYRYESVAHRVRDKAVICLKLCYEEEARNLKLKVPDAMDRFVMDAEALAIKVYLEERYG